MIRCENENIYTGITTDYERRYKEHESGKGAKYCKINKVTHLEAVWRVGESRSVALKCEIKIKKFNKDKKERLISKGSSIEIELENAILLERIL
jgi:putative endonuclease